MFDVRRTLHVSRYQLRYVNASYHNLALNEANKRLLYMWIMGGARGGIHMSSEIGNYCSVVLIRGGTQAVHLRKSYQGILIYWNYPWKGIILY